MTEDSSDWVGRPRPGQLSVQLATRKREELEQRRVHLVPRASKPERTSISIARRISRLRTVTVDTSPYAGGLAPETRNFVDVWPNYTSWMSGLSRRRIGLKQRATLKL